MPVPLNWGDNAADAAVKSNAVDGGIKIVVVKNRGTGIGTANQTYTRVPIKGDGFNAECTVVVNNDAQIESVTVSNEGFGYTYGNVDLAAGSVPTPTSPPTLDVIIPHQVAMVQISIENWVQLMLCFMQELKMMLKTQTS